MKRIFGYNVTNGAYDAVGGAENVEGVNSLLNVYADKSAAATNIVDTPIYANDVVSVSNIQYSAGQVQRSSITFAGTVLENTAYKIVLKYKGLEDSFGMKTYIVIPSALTVTALRNAFRDAINNDSSSLIAASAVSTDELKLEQKNLADMEGFEILDATALGLINQPGGTAEQDYIPAFGLGADLTASKEYSSATFLPAGQYDAFDIVFKKYAGQAFGGGAKYEEVVYRIFAETGDANFSVFQAAVLNMTNLI